MKFPAFFSASRQIPPVQDRHACPGNTMTGDSFIASGAETDGASRAFQRDVFVGCGGGDQIVLAYDAVAVLYQINWQVKNLRLYGNRLGTVAQLAPVGIKCVIGKEKSHVGAPSIPAL